MAEVIIKNVTKKYDDGTIAVNKVNIDIKDKEFVVFVGPSGCGKTTTLRMIAGLEEISDGEIYIDNKLVNNLPPKDRDIAMVFQNYALYPHMTVFENMAFGLKLRKLDKNEIDKRVKDAAKILGLENYLNRKPKALSGGQRQRVAVGRAIVRNPKVFLFDEPLSNLDAKLRVQMRTEISRLHKNLQATIIYVTHDQVEAMTMGNKIVIMKDGLIQQIDSPLNLYHSPKNKFVAGFIGSPAMNFIEGRIEKRGELKFVSADNKLTFPLNNELAGKIENLTGKEVWAGIRPENLLVGSSSLKKESMVSLSAPVDLVEPLGNQTLVYFTFENNQFVSENREYVDIENGAEESFIFDYNKVHYFYKDTEEIIT